MVFGLQLLTGGGLSGTYSLTVDFHIEASECYTTTGLVCSPSLVATDVVDNAYYCFYSCSTDFSISESPTSVSVNSGNSYSTAVPTITLSSQKAFSGAVSLDATTSDPSVQASIMPSLTVPAGGSASAYLFITAPWNVCKIGSGVTVTVNSWNGIAHSVSLSVTTLSCPPADITVWANPSQAVFGPQNAAGSNIYAQSLNGFTGTVALSFVVSPTTGSNCALSQTSITLAKPGDTNSVNLLCGENVLQTYTVTLTGTAGAISHTITISFINQSSGGGCTSSSTCPKYT
jgi:hypothetical protein